MDEQALLAALRALDGQGRKSLLDFAEFLVARSQGRPAANSPPPGPCDESVVQAIKRLTRAYPTLNKSELAARVERLLASHMMEGRPAPEVIAALEKTYAEQQAKRKLA